MAQTLAAVFDRREAAEQARQKLISAGYGSERIRLNDAASDYSGLPSTSAGNISAADAARDDEGFVASIKHFFADLFGSHDDRYVYAEAVSRGHVVLTLEGASDAEIDRASDIVEDFGPINIEEHSEQWRAGGWSRDDDSLRTSSTANLSGMGSASNLSGASLQSMTPPTGMGGELGIGGAGNLTGNLSGGSQDLSTASQQFARDESLGTSGPAAVGDTGRAASIARNVRSYPRADSLQNLGSDDEQYYRSHWDRTYLSTGARYEDYDPAYRYGRSMADSDTYRGRPWDEVEPDLRSNWEHTYPQSAWENFKAAVRHGWDRLTS